MLSNGSDSNLISLNDAASWASNKLGLSFEIHDMLALVRLNLLTAFPEECETFVDRSEVLNFSALVDWHSYEPGTLSLLGAERVPLPDAYLRGGWIDLKVHSNLSISIPVFEFRSFICQIFISEFRRTTVLAKKPSAGALAIVAQGMVRFVSNDEELARSAASLWADVTERAREVTDLERSVTLSLYGVKTRIIPFVSAVIETLAEGDAVVCDLMSGSGIVSRKAATSHSVFANDANSYGAITARALTQGLDPSHYVAIVDRVKVRMAENVRALESIYGDYLVQEFEILNAERTVETLDRYRAFCDEIPAAYDAADAIPGTPALDLTLREMIRARRSDVRAFPFILASAYWANVHYGLRQAILLDSLRYAIEFENDSDRVCLLAALLQAALISASGPHFAQPFKAKGVPQFKVLADKRLRRVDAEFFRALSQFAHLKPANMPLIRATKKNWREALLEFREGLGGRPGVVYADPPYTAVQYSRYYHVLNVLVDYDYPVCTGPGRCPVKEYRFSSRFEFKAGPARREIQSVIQQCAELGLSLILSYSKSGTITIRDIVLAMRQHYRNVEVFQTPLRHNAQGKASSGGRLDTLEFLVAGKLPKSQG